LIDSNRSSNGVATFQTSVQNGNGCERCFVSISFKVPARAVSIRHTEAPHDAYVALFRGIKKEGHKSDRRHCPCSSLSFMIQFLKS
jgi:hypothetical protein